MALTFAQLYTQLRENMGDDSTVDWTDAQLKNAIKNALRISFPYFYVSIADITTYTGVSAPGQNTTQVAVPAAFYSTAGPGKITRVEWRSYKGSGTNYSQWQPLRRGLYIDDLKTTSPQIRFTVTRGVRGELQIYGQRPVIIPTSDSDTVEATDYNPFIVWIYFAAEKFARAARQEAQQYDTEAQSQRRVFATQDMIDLAEIHRMRSPGQTFLTRW